MECDKHKNRIVLHAFSKGKCEKCGKNITTSHTPCNKVCEACSDKYNLCEACGEEVDNNNK